tara:strand:+ start:587 stop:760 length:174 start_codon:yes stop_codon:yes gene_type:complete
METPKIMVVHGIIIGLLAYLVMLFLLKQSASVAEYRSVLLGLISVLYMMHFGHRLPM